MEGRNTLGIGTDSHLTEFVNIESAAIDAINAEENEKKKALASMAMGKAAKMSGDDKDDDEEGDIKKIWAKNMVPVIELWGRRIAAAGAKMDPEASKEEIDEFLATLSNPEDVQEYLYKWSNSGADLEEGLGGSIMEEIEDGDIEIVVDVTDEVLEGNDYLENFVVDFLGGLEDSEDGEYNEN